MIASLFADLKVIDCASCQLLAQTTYPYTTVKERGKALLERSCERVEGTAVHTDHPPTPPSAHSRERPDIAAQPYHAVALEPSSGRRYPTQPLLTP